MTACWPRPLLLLLLLRMMTLTSRVITTSSLCHLYQLITHHHHDCSLTNHRQPSTTDGHISPVLIVWFGGKTSTNTAVYLYKQFTQNRFCTGQGHCGVCRKSYRHWSVLLWWDPNDVPHRRILPASLCWWCCYCRADQLWVLIAYARRRMTSSSSSSSGNL